MRRELVVPDDLRAVAAECADALRPARGRDWTVRAGSLEWSCSYTLFHAGRAVYTYAAHLAGRWQEPTSFRIGSLEERSTGQEASPRTLIDVMRSHAAILADVASATPPEVRAYHMAGMADRSGFLAMACDELLVHTDDILHGLGSRFEPRTRAVARVVARLFPWAPTDTDPWATLRWTNGRCDLGDHPSPGPDWIWHCAPLEQWDGTMPSMPG